MEQIIVRKPEIGDKVVRGRDWSHGDQDANSVYGVVTGNPETEGWVYVEWKNSEGETIHENAYAVGATGNYDLYYYEDHYQHHIDLTPTPEYNAKEQWAAIITEATNSDIYKSAPAGKKFSALLTYLHINYEVPRNLTETNESKLIKTMKMMSMMDQE